METGSIRLREERLINTIVLTCAASAINMTLKVCWKLEAGYKFLKVVSNTFAREEVSENTFAFTQCTFSFRNVKWHAIAKQWPTFPPRLGSSLLYWLSFKDSFINWKTEHLVETHAWSFRGTRSVCAWTIKSSHLFCHKKFNIILSKENSSGD